MQYESEPRLVTLAGPLRPRPDESRPIWRGDCYAMPVSPTNNAPYDSALAVIRGPLCRHATCGIVSVHVRFARDGAALCCFSGALSSANLDAKGQATLRTSLNE